MKLTVVHLEGAKKGRTEHLPGPVIHLGRDPACELQFDPEVDLDVSARHASIAFEGARVLLQDLGSRNGTFLDGKRVEGPTPLRNDAVIELGTGGPRIKVNWVAGMGQKTRMIHELSEKLESADEAARRTKWIVAGAALLVALLAAGAVTAAVIRGRWVDYHRVVDAGGLREQASAARGRAERQGARDEPEAVEAWRAGLEALALARAAGARAEWGEAADRYAIAARRFDEAGAAAAGARLAALTERLGQLDREARRLAEEAEEARRARDDEIRRAVEAARSEAAAELAALERRLAEADEARLREELAGLVASTDKARVERGVAEVKKRLARSPDDAELRALLPRLEARVLELTDAATLLDRAARQAKGRVVAVHAHVFAIAPDQELHSAEVQLTVARGRATGFVASERGHLLTAKEALLPHLFDPQALALYTHLAGQGMRFFARAELHVAAEGGAYQKAHEALLELDGEGRLTPVASGALRILEVLETRPGATRDVTIALDDGDHRLAVAPHLRGPTALALLQVQGSGGPRLAIAPGAPAPESPVATLGTQQGGPDLDPDEIDLFLFQGEVVRQSERLLVGTPAYPSWIGGPVLDAQGRVVGLLIDPGSRQSWAVPAQVLRELLEGT